MIGGRGFPHTALVVDERNYCRHFLPFSRSTALALIDLLATDIISGQMPNQSLVRLITPLRSTLPPHGQCLLNDPEIDMQHIV